MIEPIGLIGFCTSRNSLVSKIIRFFRKDFINQEFIPSHTFVIFGKMGGELILGESTDPYMRLYPLSKYFSNLNKRIELWEVTNIDVINKIKAVEKMLPYTGKTYGYIQLIGYIWLWVGKKLGFKVSNPVDTKDQMPCAEYSWLFLRDMGYSDVELMSMCQNDIAPDSILTTFIKDVNCRKVAVKEYDSTELIWIVNS